MFVLPFARCTMKKKVKKLTDEEYEKYVRDLLKK